MDFAFSKKVRKLRLGHYLKNDSSYDGWRKFPVRNRTELLQRRKTIFTSGCDKVLSGP
jgi:hypothetical protein